MSKTRKTKKKGGKKPAKGPSTGPRKAPPKAATGTAEKPAVAARKTSADDEFVYVPRGKSRATYLFILGLMVFTLIIFVVPGEFQALFTSREDPGSKLFMSWDHPRLGHRELTVTEFENQRRELARFFGTFGFDEEGIYDYESIATFLVTEALAKDAGVEVSAEDLAKAILEGEPGRTRGFGTKEAYEQLLQRVRLTPPEFEGTMRRAMRVWRYELLTSAVTGAWRPETIEESWRQRHEEYTLDLVGLATEDFTEAASAELPDAAELKSWYEALPPRSGAFAADWRGEQKAAEVVGYAPDEDTAAGLLERFPAPETFDAAAAAQQYYDRVFFARFVREAQLPAAPEPAPPEYIPFEEVQEVATAEARIHRAMGEWLADVRSRLEAGETVDLALEAAELGLSYQAPAEPRDLAGWREPEEGAEARWSGVYLGSGIFRAGPEGLVPDVVVDGNGIVIARVTETIAAGPAPYEEVVEKVTSEWIAERAGELALEQARELYDALVAAAAADVGEEEAVAQETEGETEAATERPEVDAEAFAAAAAALGLEVVHQDWFDPSESGPVGDELPPAEKYARQAVYRLALEENQVAEPVVDAATEHVWLVRSGGKREPPELDIEPQELADLQRSASFTAFFEASEARSFDAYSRQYGLFLDRDDREAEDPGLEDETAGTEDSD